MIQVGARGLLEPGAGPHQGHAHGLGHQTMHSYWQAQVSLRRHKVIHYRRNNYKLPEIIVISKQIKPYPICQFPETRAHTHTQLLEIFA